MNSQEIFDKVCQHLRSQRGRSMRGHGTDTCAYEDAQGRRCAIGIFIPDEHEGLDFRGDVFKLFSCYPELKELICPKDYDDFSFSFLVRLQCAHDDGTHWSDEGYFNEKGEKFLEKIAQSFRLIYEKVEEKV